MKSIQQILSISFFSLLFLSQANSQVQVALGLKGGAAFGTTHVTQMLDQVTPDFKFAPGWTAGGVAEISFGNYFALQPEISWMQKGFRWDESTGIDIGKVEVPVGARADFRSNYLEAPLLAKLKLGNERVQGYLVAGPSFGYALKAKIITTPRVFFEFDPIKTDVNLDNIDYERFEVSAVGGLGVQLNLGGLKLFADARYQHGFTELYDFPLVNEKIKNRGISASIGAMIDLMPTPKKVPARGPQARRR